MPAWIRFASDNLATNEKILYQTRTHWIILVWPTLWALAYLIGLLMVPTIDLQSLKASPLEYGISNPLALLGVIFYPLTIAGTFSLILALIRMLTTEITITNQRIIWKTGLAWRNTGEIARRVIEGNNLDQSILGRILDYGTIWVNGIGNQRLALHTINNPLDFRGVLNRVTQTQTRPTSQSRTSTPN